MKLYFSDVFNVPKDSIDKYGAFDVSLVTDFPLFVDPFLLFNSPKKEYQDLHGGIIKYLQFLRNKSLTQQINEGLLKSWFYFSEVKQNWLGFTFEGNVGRGLGRDFAIILNRNLGKLFAPTAAGSITRGTHLEKLCLIKPGVGRDTISDFTTNLIKDYLLKYTESFAKNNINPKYTKQIPVNKAKFNYNTETWETGIYTLPFSGKDYVLLTPKDILTKDDTWINKADFIDDFFEIADSVSDGQLRAELENYLKITLEEKPTKRQLDKAVFDFSLKFPTIIDYYIKRKEDKGDLATERSLDKIFNSDKLYVEQFGGLVQLLVNQTAFYNLLGITATEAYLRITYLKDVIENKGGWKFFYDKNGQPVRKEEDLHIMYRLTWYATTTDVSQEVNDGRGPADFKISLGSSDKTIVKFKLAGNPQLKQNLQKQVDAYKKASDAQFGYKVIVYFNDEELKKVQQVLREIGMFQDKNIVLIDAGQKISASKL